MSEVLVIGEAIADFLPTDEEARGFQCVLGGSGYNTALALARLGLRPSYAWSLSNDVLGQRFSKAAAAEGIDVSRGRISDRPTPVAIVRPSAASHGAMFALHLAGTAHEDVPDLPSGLPVGISHVHAASFAVTAGAAAMPCLALMQDAKAQATSSYDPNIRASCLPPHAEAMVLIEERVAASTMAKASVEDFGWMYPHLAPHEAMQRWLALGCSIAVMTRGAKGAVAMTMVQTVEVPAPLTSIVDTVGAGDTFTAGFLAGMARDGRLGVPDHVASSDELTTWLAFAARAASISCARPGCDPPRLAELI